MTVAKSISTFVIFNPFYEVLEKSYLDRQEFNLLLHLALFYSGQIISIFHLF